MPVRQSVAPAFAAEPKQDPGTGFRWKDKMLKREKSAVRAFSMQCSGTAVVFSVSACVFAGLCVRLSLSDNRRG